MGITGKLIAEIVLLAAVWWMAVTFFDPYEVQDWLWEMWRFVKQIIPLLIVGVFVAGMARAVIPATWIQAIAGRNTWWASLVGVLFGVFMYFPTLVEVPIAQTFLSLGMHRGPLLAYLISDPELSLQSILITAAIIGRKKAWTYVGWVALFSTLSGLIYGAWVDGASLGWVIIILTIIVAVLTISIWFFHRRNRGKAATTTATGGRP